MNDLSGFKAIPYFRRYLINKEGVIFNVRTKKILTPKQTVFGTFSVNMTDDKNNRTTRTPAILVREIFGEGLK